MTERMRAVLGVSVVALAIPSIYYIVRSLKREDPIQLYGGQDHIAQSYNSLTVSFAGKSLQVQYSSSEFVLSAGAVAFQFDSAGIPRRVVLVHHKPLDAWLLAKGRKDEGEDLATTAVREVHEETGYRCRLHPVPRLPTCAPLPAALAGVGLQSQAARVAHESTEPFMITLRWLSHSQLKLIFWYVGTIDIPYISEGSASSESDEFGVQPPGTHQLEEGFDEVRICDISEALQMLAYEGDREVVRKAVDILTRQSSVP